MAAANQKGQGEIDRLAKSQAEGERTLRTQCDRLALEAGRLQKELDQEKTVRRDEQSRALTEQETARAELAAHSKRLQQIERLYREMGELLRAGGRTA